MAVDGTKKKQYDGYTTAETKRRSGMKRTKGMMERVEIVEILGTRIPIDRVRNIVTEEGYVTVEYNDLDKFPCNDIETVVTVKSPERYVNFITGDR